jgi:hypothetical protein
MPVQILTDIMTENNSEGEKKRRLLWQGYCGNSITRGVFSLTSMVILSKYTLIEKEPGSGVFC